MRCPARIFRFAGFCGAAATPQQGRGLLLAALRRVRGLSVFALLAGCLLFNSASAFAASAMSAPHSGLEGGQGRSYGPDVEKRSGNNLPQTSMPMDAYGNPITGEREEARPKVRPRAGAYGGYGKQSKGASRPLPDPPAVPKWGFN